MAAAAWGVSSEGARVRENDVEFLTLLWSLSNDELMALSNLKIQYYDQAAPVPSSNYDFLKVLMACKWSVDLALTKIPIYIGLRDRLGLSARLALDPLLPVLATGRYQLQGTDRDGHPVLYVAAATYVPAETVLDDEIRAIVFLLEYAWRTNPAAGRHGITVVVDLSGARVRANFDKDAGRELVMTLQSAYPMRVRRVALVNPTLSQRLAMRSIKSVMKAGLRDKVEKYTHQTLTKIIAPDQLPERFGGSLSFSFARWLKSLQQQEALLNPGAVSTVELTLPVESGSLEGGGEAEDAENVDDADYVEPEYVDFVPRASADPEYQPFGDGGGDVSADDAVSVDAGLDARPSANDGDYEPFAVGSPEYEDYVPSPVADDGGEYSSHTEYDDELDLEPDDFAYPELEYEDYTWYFICWSKDFGRPIASSAGRYVRLNTAAFAAEPDGPFIPVDALDLRRYAKRQHLAKILFGYILYVESNPLKALELATYAHERAKFKDWWWKLQIGKCYYQIGLLRDAQKFYLSSLVSQDMVETYLHLGKIFFRLDQPAKAIDTYVKAMTVHPHEPSLVIGLARVHDALGETQRAVALYRDVLRIDPSNIEAAASLGSYHFYSDTPEIALRYYRRLLQMGVYTTSIWNNIGLCCFFGQQFDMALSCFERALALASDDDLAQVWYNISHVALATGDLNLAYQACKLALAADPDHAQAINNLGVLELLMGNGLSAKTEFVTSSTLAPWLTVPHYNTGLVAYKLGEFEAAFKAASDALALDPDHAPSKALMDSLSKSLSRSV
ncbi:uncharacterized protein AMSG_12184 [Thecamonas trahens ATCC 50062]|uniref:CRAL-TRIO domain-containing protein n=1 Tax=Thecamonas trahens ATCC 50062 TaxID=461836 RepID=A0A0L0DL12_THETB|nr:hypothetical protein AMSG_12184 [Thecamonas trahens ATCC 50062]KNC52711.1 hypothetical protein AMSG_12184 [Thecamonas trahens ATCC 50062]|eukprot:XP_013755126.1 hypothetical protein AMSG_12184 [Thecamonas trahens ATCC 50062]